MLYVPRSYNQDSRSNEVSQVDTKFCTVGCEDRTREREAEEYPLLEAVAKERLVKTQQAGKGLAAAMTICELLRLAVAQ
jgi:hypothetical protein